jgi:hypothetical protein
MSVDNCSLWLDVKILAMTLGKVFRREGTSAQGEATMPEFMGTYKQEAYNEVRQGVLQAAAVEDNNY